MHQVSPTGESFTLIHYVFQTDPERVACMPNMTEFGRTMFHDMVLRSNATNAVTCQACKKTEHFKNPKVKYG